MADSADDLPAIPNWDESSGKRIAPDLSASGPFADLDDEQLDAAQTMNDAPVLPPVDVEPSPAIRPQTERRKRNKPPHPADDPNLGRSFGGYILVDRIGHGGMGTVYRGRQVSLDREVAVKLLNASLVDNDQFIKRFQREAKSIARINHPNVVGVYDFGESDGTYYMVIEYVRGTNLARLINERLVLPVSEVANLVCQCLEGLDHIAKSGFVHRDIKPDNILITDNGIAKLADFGLAKEVNDSSGTDLTAVGSAMGTPAYMSPERCMGHELDIRSDIYALGVTAYLALTGEKPFVGKSSFEIMTKHREYMPPAPHQLNPQIGSDVSAVVMKMLVKNPAQRYQTALECRDAWQPFTPENARRYGSGAYNNPVPASSDQLPDPVVPQMGTEPVPAPMRVEAPLRPSTDHIERENLPEHHDDSNARGNRRNRSEEIANNKAITCAACGMLNRGDVTNCQRCGQQLNKRGQTESLDEREMRAQRLYDQGMYNEAADVYGQLAAQVQDKRQRAVLRTKERDARSYFEEMRFTELTTRTQTLLRSGRIDAGIDILERGMQESRSSALTSRLSIEVGNLRALLRRRRRRKIILICTVLMIAALLFIGLLFRQPILAWWQGLTPSTAPGEATR